MKYTIKIPDNDHRFLSHDNELTIPITVGLDTEFAYETGLKLEPYTEPVNEIIESNKINLCDSCKHDYPDCWVKHNDIIFGGGVDDENICCCKKYEPDTLDRKVIEQEVWEFARMVRRMNIPDWIECFEQNTLAGIYDLDCSEAKAKYEEWKNRNIRVGDEVIYNSRTKAVVLIPETKEKYGTILTDDFATIVVSHDELEKTGRHFDDIAELLKKMKEG